jgi:hypothetical protein
MLGGGVLVPANTITNTSRAAKESGELALLSSASAGLRQRRLINTTTTFSTTEETSSLPNTTSSRAKNPLPPPRASTLVAITTTSVGTPSDSTSFSTTTTGSSSRSFGTTEDEKTSKSQVVAIKNGTSDETFSPSSSSWLMAGDSTTNQRCWVIVFGVTSSVFTTILYPKLESFGTIERHIISSSNWMAIQYSSELQAEKACCQNGSTLILEDGNILLIGVLRCTPHLFHQLRLPSYLSSSTNTTSMGQLPPSATTATLRLPPNKNQQQQQNNQTNDEDIFLQSTSDPTIKNKSKGIIGSILGWFFMW